GYRLSSQPAEAVAVQRPPPSYPQIVAARNIAAGHALMVGDVRVTSMPQRDPHGYSNVSEVVGKLAMEPIAEGSPLLTSHFPVLGAIAQSVRPDERAVAVKVNEVIGVGGFISPGDHVDVLLYLRADRETANASSAQVLLSDVRVLAYGDEIDEEKSAEPPPAGNRQAQSGVVAEGVKKLEAIKGKAGKSAILAVPEKDVARLMLGDSSGTLRLALRGAIPVGSATTEAAKHFTRLEEVAQAQGAGIAANNPVIQFQPDQFQLDKQAKKESAPAGDKANQVILHRGDQVEIISVKN
ncbi:MAG TPA: Flp pilus assembly protein CpaB, partial [Methylophilaceae bacterium]|nr:Flp pilus assembly protein CpaB [Methylophilaceae bacterium]